MNRKKIKTKEGKKMFISEKNWSLEERWEARKKEAVFLNAEAAVNLTNSNSYDVTIVKDCTIARSTFQYGSFSTNQVVCINTTFEECTFKSMYFYPRALIGVWFLNCTFENCCAWNEQTQEFEWMEEGSKLWDNNTSCCTSKLILKKW